MYVALSLHSEKTTDICKKPPAPSPGKISERSAFYSLYYILRLISEEIIFEKFWTHFLVHFFIKSALCRAAKTHQIKSPINSPEFLYL